MQSAYYTPSADDIGATVCFRCQDKHDPNNKGFAQIGPLRIEPSVREGVADAMKAGRGSFPVTISSRPGQVLRLEFDDASVRVLIEEESGEDAIFSSTFARFICSTKHRRHWH